MKKNYKFISVLLAASMLSVPIVSLPANAAVDDPIVESDSSIERPYREEIAINYYCSLADKIINEYADYYTEESITNLRSGELDAMWVSPLIDGVEDYSQDDFVIALENFENSFLELEPVKDVSNIVTYDKAKRMYELAALYYNIDADSDQYRFAINTLESYGGYYYIGVSPATASPMINVFHIKDYSFEVNNVYEKSELCELAIDIDTEETLPIEDAFRCNKIDVDSFFEYYLDHSDEFTFKMFINGDADFDNKLTVMDATEIQKILAGLSEHNSSKSISELVYDADGDGKISVTDATYIQKKLVGLPADDDFEYVKDVPPFLPANIKPLDKETENMIKQDFIRDKNISENDVEIYYYGTLSDGSMLVYPEVYGAVYFQWLVFEEIGDYIYSMCCGGVDVKIYKDHNFYSIKEAYERGRLSDSDLDETAEILGFLKK